MKKHTFGEWMIAIRPWAFPASAMPVLVSVAYLFWTGAEMNWLMALWVLVTMMLFHAAGNTWSDYFDFRKKVDTDDTFGAKTLTTGMFQPSEIRNLAIVLISLACLSGIGIVLCTDIRILWFGLAGAFLAMAYPYLKYNALGDVDILLTFAFIPTVGVSLAVTGAIDWSILWIAVPVGLITDGILHSNNTRDIMTDSRAGIRTMAMGMGVKAAAWLYVFEVIFPFLWVGVCSLAGILPFSTIVIFMAVPIAIACAKTMTNSVKGGPGLIADLDIRTSNLQLAFSLLLSAAFVIARFL